MYAIQPRKAVFENDIELEATLFGLMSVFDLIENTLMIIDNLLQEEDRQHVLDGLRWVAKKGTKEIGKLLDGYERGEESKTENAAQGGRKNNGKV